MMPMRGGKGGRREELAAEPESLCDHSTEQRLADVRWSVGADLFAFSAGMQGTLPAEDSALNGTVRRGEGGDEATPDDKRTENRNAPQAFRFRPRLPLRCTSKAQ
jgi:hypothetical protein